MTNRAHDWFAQAERDLDQARSSLSEGRHEWACFAAQQSAGKAVKALHLALGQEGWGHVVARLLRELPVEVPSELVDVGRVLDDVYTPTRDANLTTMGHRSSTSVGSRAMGLGAHDVRIGSGETTLPFAVPDLRDLTDALRLHPEWREEVRRLVLTEEVLRLPALVAELAAAQGRTEARLEQLSERVEELAAAQGRTEARLEQLSERMEELAAAQGLTEARLEQLSKRMEELAAAQLRTELKVGELADGQKRLVDRSAHFEGELLELHYARKAGSYFGRLIRRARVVTFQDLEDQLRSSLGNAELEEVLNLDLMVGGRLLSFDPPREVLLAVEVSVAISHDDVERASRRAEVLRRATGVVIPVVAGRGGTLEVEDHARDLGVTILHDGKARLWPESVDRWATAPA